VLGNSDQGLRSASLALANSTVRSQMSGNLVVIYDNQVIVDQVEMAPVTAATTQVVVQSTPEAGTGSKSGPFQLNFVTIGLVVLAVIIVLVLVALLVKPKRKKLIG
jgi:hypothetical protein